LGACGAILAPRLHAIAMALHCGLSPRQPWGEQANIGKARYLPCRNSKFFTVFCASQNDHVKKCCNSLKEKVLLIVTYWAWELLSYFQIELAFY
jgi:hypothetical protein